jgi:murein L,D-transpeptidase YafK
VTQANRSTGRLHWSLWRSLSLTVLAAAVVAGDVSAMSRHPSARGLVSRTLQSSEAMLVQSLISIRESRLADALAQINDLLEINPNYRLAQLIKGDLLLARARPLSTMGNVVNAPAGRIDELRAEARARLSRYQLEPPRDVVPKYLLQMLPQQNYAVVVDTARSTLYVFENDAGRLRYAADYYVTVGKNGINKVREGDKKTPLGVYHITGQLPAKKLTDFYGTGAFPINYPNEWDQRQGRRGHGIWLHGTPRDTYSRPPRASDGCLVLANDDLVALGTRVQAGLTPVVIADGIEWVPAEEVDALRATLSQQLEQWRADWASRDRERTLSHYSRQFGGRASFNGWGAHKRRIDPGKGSSEVRLTDVSIFLYPGRDDLAVVTFLQNDSRSNPPNQMRKRQYWIQEGGVWKIAYEGAA